VSREKNYEEFLSALLDAFEAVPPRDINEAREELRAVGFDPVQFARGLTGAWREKGTKQIRVILHAKRLPP
jgi:hypothetical protein